MSIKEFFHQVFDSLGFKHHHHHHDHNLMAHHLGRLAQTNPIEAEYFAAPQSRHAKGHWGGRRRFLGRVFGHGLGRGAMGLKFKGSDPTAFDQKPPASQKTPSADTVARETKNASAPSTDNPDIESKYCLGCERVCLLSAMKCSGKKKGKKKKQ
ncbi:MAG: hypothetical protein LBF38_09160 [Deltaproteobacteria bacterium]|nr:hypothetical protein [Deltaproteobacteria bacterium]